MLPTEATSLPKEQSKTPRVSEPQTSLSEEQTSKWALERESGPANSAAANLPAVVFAVLPPSRLDLTFACRRGPKCDSGKLRVASVILLN